MNRTILNNNTEKHRYELIDDGKLVCFSEYDLTERAVRFRHTEVVPGHEGKGYGSVLAKQALDDVRDQRKKVIPVCEFIAGYIRKHGEYADLIGDNS